MRPWEQASYTSHTKRKNVFKTSLQNSDDFCIVNIFIYWALNLIPIFCAVYCNEHKKELIAKLPVYFWV